MRLYVANLTAQHMDFAYIIPEHEGQRGGVVRTQKIPLGTQIAISGDLKAFQIDAIIKHHARYGMVAHNDIDKSRQFVGVCYSIDVPVRSVVIREGIEHNLQALIERGKQFRQEAAIAVNNSMEMQLAEQGRPEGLRELAMSIVEEEPSGGYRTEKPIGEGVIVRRDEPGENRPQRRRGQRAAA